MILIWNGKSVHLNYDVNDEPAGREWQQIYTPDPIDLDVLRAIKAFDGQKNIWINEDLKARWTYLLFQARKMKKSKDIIDCWSNDGNVLVKNKFRKIVPIHNIQMLPSVNNAGSNVMPHSQTQPDALG